MSGVNARVVRSPSATTSTAKAFDAGPHFDAPSADRRSNQEGGGKCGPVEISDKQAVFLDALANSGSGELKRVRLEVEDGQIRLAGRVSSFYVKQLAQEVLRPLAIGMQISNELRVDS
jgi:hypothetical protein